MKKNCQDAFGIKTHFTCYYFVNFPKNFKKLKTNKLLVIIHKIKINQEMSSCGLKT